MRIDLSCPIENQGAIVKTNSETGELYLLLKLFNLSEQQISAVDFHVFGYGANGEELGNLAVTLENLEAAPKAYFAETKAISLVGMEDAKHFVVSIDKALFENGDIYEPAEEHTIEADCTDASIDDAMLLRKFVPEAVCFASENENYYRCVCGRINFLSAENCVRCGRDKKEMLGKFSSHDALLKTMDDAQEEAALQKAKEEAHLLMEKQQKTAKAKKITLIALIAVLVAVIVAVAGFFTYRAILNINAKKAIENNDYAKAYMLYQKTGSDKIGELTRYVEGNTPANLMFQSGLLASDEDNLYYLMFDNSTSAFSLVRENKNSKEKTILTDAAGGSLNITKDWIYFVGVEDGYVKRISKDGETIENFMDTPVSHLSVIGNDLYYIKTDFNNPNNLSEEQCEILAAQGQMETYRHLYKMNINSKKTKLICEDSIGALYIHNNKIYYLTDNTDEWLAYNLYSMNLDGTGKKAVVDVPVATFYIRGDDLYYAKMYNDAAKGNQISSFNDLDYALYKKNLKDGTTSSVTPNHMVTYLNGNDNTLFFTALDREAYIASMTSEDQTATTQVSPVLYSMDMTTGEMVQLVAGDVSIFNVCGEDIILFLQSQGMCRVKTDGTGFELLLPESEQTEQVASDSENSVVE